MKPKDLKPPFTWKERKVLLEDKVLYVPEYCSDYRQFVFPGWSAPELFGNSRPVRIEYCSGNGDWIANRAAADPNSNWVAVEKLFDRSRKIWSKRCNNHLDNLCIVCGEGLMATNLFFPPASVEEVFVNFPDPWPKQRHAKHRIISQPFLSELSRILVDGGSATLVTDDFDYVQRMAAQFQKSGQFTSVFPEPYYTINSQEYGPSFFNTLWREEGRQIYNLKFKKS